VNYRVLEWDSRFFGVRVAQLMVTDTSDCGGLEECLEGSDADVVYVSVAPAAAELCRPLLAGLPGGLFDRKVTYAKEVDPAFAAPDPFCVRATGVSEELLQLAYASGHLSRFFLDPRFRPWFRPLYAEWVRKELREADSRVFTLSDDHPMLGMVTASVKDGIGRIGLLAIAEGSQGRGLGMRLVRHCEAHYASQSARRCEVVTQKANVAACRLYAKAGYTIASEQDIWHIWKG